ncbi:MAG: hypothetical protein KAX15_08175, partial [Candidatus Omnitrophica bacterium]|nr:hypothetical protein [Candidatus Omnitrophota bacterium]
DKGSHFVQFWSEDNSNNLEARQFLNVKIDKTPPVTTYSFSREPGGSSGWFNELPVTVSYSATDDLSGVLSTTKGETINLETKEKIKYFSEDIAGNVEKVKKLTIKIDISEPIVMMSLKPNILWPLSRKPVKVNVFGQTFDNLSGIASQEFTVIDEYGKVEPTVSGFGSKIKLVPWRKADDKDGRIYTIRVVVTDKAGNSNTMEKTVRVPWHIEDVKRERKEAEEQRKKEEEQRKKEKEQWKKEEAEKQKQGD